MEPFLVQVKSNESKEFIASSHEGEEFIYVLDGSVEITYGNDVFTLQKGDSIYYDSILKHHVHSKNSDATILAVVYAPF